MDIETGEIKYFKNDEELQEAIAKNKGTMVEIDPGDMTERQRELNAVSLYDNRSKLGKLRIKEKAKCQNGNKRRRHRRKT